MNLECELGQYGQAPSEYLGPVCINPTEAEKKGKIKGTREETGAPQLMYLAKVSCW